MGQSPARCAQGYSSSTQAFEPAALAATQISSRRAGPEGPVVALVQALA